MGNVLKAWELAASKTQAVQEGWRLVIGPAAHTITKIEPGGPDLITIHTTAGVATKHHDTEVHVCKIKENNATK